MSDASRADSYDPTRSADYPWGETLHRFWALVRPIRFKLLAGFLCAAIGSITALMIPQVLQSLVNNLQSSPTRTAVVAAAGLVLGLGVLEAVFVYLRRTFAVSPSTGVELGMRKTLFDRLLKLPVAFHDAWGSGQLLSRSMADLGEIRRWIAFGMIMTITDVVTLTVGILLLVRSSGILALVFAVAAVPILIISYRFGRNYRVLSRRSQEQSGDLATTVEQSVQGIRVLKGFGRGGYMLHGFAGQASTLRNTEVAKATSIGLFDLSMIALPESALAIALFIGLLEVDAGNMSIGALAAYFTTAMMITGPVRMLGQNFAQLVNTKTALDRHWEVLDAPLGITDPPVPESLPGVADPLHPDPVEVRFEDVHFRYPDAPAHMPDVLRGVDLTVLPGETLALVGVTGSGKSSLLNLVPRLFDVSQGSVRLDDVDVRSLPLAELRKADAITFEDPTLFSASVRDNVLLGTDRSLTDQQKEELLRLALRTADAEYVYGLPDGVDTAIGEEGLSLSGGQRQRLALARSIATHPRVLLLDDPLSALDTRTEELVTERLREVLRGTTTLIVAHRPSTVALADRVALLDDGRIEAIGTHHELLASSERYRYVIASLDEDEEKHRAEAETRTSQQPAVPNLREEVDLATGEFPALKTTSDWAEGEPGGVCRVDDGDHETDRQRNEREEDRA